MIKINFQLLKQTIAINKIDVQGLQAVCSRIHLDYLILPQLKFKINIWQIMIRKKQKIAYLCLINDVIITSKKRQKNMETAENINRRDVNTSIDLSFKDITYQVEEKGQSSSCFSGKEGSSSKTILHGVSGIFKGGELTAIMGSSGAGKTTLLNVISGRVTKFKGQLYANNLPYTFENFGNFANYVMQQDILMQTLTVRETLMFAASLKYTSLQKKQEKILKLTKTFKLQKCLDVLIGGPSLKGISGGEKKRTSIVFQLISDPQVLALDEPTSGMDSLTSFIIVNELKILANQGKTIFLTIHQPNSQIFDLFDRLLLMVEGKIIYQGRADMSLDYFQKNFKLVCPSYANPADFLIEIIHHQKAENVQRYQSYFDTYHNVLKDSIEAQIQHRQKGEIVNRVVQTTELNNLKQLVKRDLINIARNPVLVKSRFIQILYLTVYIGGLYFNSGRKDYMDPINWNTIAGYLFFISLDILFQSMMPLALVFPQERSVFLKEENSKMYGVISYFISRNIVDIPFSIILPAIYSLVTYWMVGLSSTAEQFFTMYLILMLMSFVGSSMGLLAGSFLQDEKAITEILPIILLPLVIISGFFKNTANMSSWYSWIQYISPFKYGFIAITENQVKYRDSLVDQLKFDMHLWESVAALVGLGIFLRILSCYFLWLKKKKLE